jgi:opacity protein-like surface antigen
MNSRTFLRSVVTVVALSAVPAAAVAQMKIIAVQAKAGGTTYGVAPNQEQIPVNVGDRVRIDLVGTSIEAGRGVERPVNARFNVAAGRGQIDIAQAGSNWVMVNVRSAGEAQLGYSVAGNYDMRGNLRDGRITFQIADNGRRGGVGGMGGPGRGNERWDRAQDLTRRLYRGILGSDPRGDEARRDTEVIARDGSSGVRSVALDLADNVRRNHNPRMGEDEAVRELGNLYRGLLGRNAGDRELWDRDSGFRGNVNTLRRDGIVRIVDVIVTSEEFRSVNHLDELDRDRGGRDDHNHGYDRNRGYDQNRDRRPPQR